MGLIRAEEDKFRIRLKNEEKTILSGKKFGSSSIVEENKNLRETVLDEGEQAESSSRMHVNISVSEEVSLRLKKIRGAIKRINRGTFGKCIDCKEEIPLARLEAVPWESQCLACKDLEENVISKPSRTEEVVMDAES